MKKLLTITGLLFVCICVAQTPDSLLPRDPWKNTRDGNDAYKRKDFVGAEKKYSEALKTDTSVPVASYNRGNALYQQKKYEEAEKAYADGLGVRAKDSLNRGWYNLGNALLEQKKYPESINAYKEALRNNPADENARYNLAYAQKMLKDQQQKQNPDQNSGDGQGDQKDKKDQKDQQDKKDKKDPKDDKKKNQPDPNKRQMSPEEAKKMMEALKNEEQKTRQRLNKGSDGSDYHRSKDKDW